jgi:hypothetical protein
MHDDSLLHAWFIINLHTRVSCIFTQYTVNQYLHNIQAVVIRTRCKNNKDPRLTWRASFLLMVANSHPLWSLAW